MKVKELVSLLSSYPADAEVLIFNGGSYESLITTATHDAFQGRVIVHGGYRNERIRDFCLAMKCGIEFAKYQLEKHNYNLALAIQDYQRGQTVS